MKKKYLIDNIKSKYLIDIIIEYSVRNTYKYKLNLAFYSKSFQKKLGINLKDYKYFYINRNFNINDYKNINFLKKNFDKNEIYKRVEIKLESMNLSLNELKNILIYSKTLINNDKKVLVKQKKEKKKFLLDINTSDYQIDIFSPFIDIIAKFFHNDIFINIPLDYIIKYNLGKDYYSFLSQNDKYYKSLFFSFQELKQIIILPLLNIDFSIIKHLYFYNHNYLKSVNFSQFFSTFFLLNNLDNNLEALCLDFSNCYIDPGLFNQINNFKSLKIIEFNGIIFNNDFKIKLNTLQFINLIDCININFDNDNATKNVEKLKLCDIDIISEYFPYRFQNIEYLYIFNSTINLDYSSLNKLKKLKIKRINKIIIENIINNTSLESICILNYSKFIKEIEEKIVLELILKSKTLKKINIILFQLTKDDIMNINIINNNITKIKLRNYIYNFDLKNFILKFPNIKEFEINSLLVNEKQYIKIENNDLIKIEKIRIISFSNSVVSCSFSNIESIYFDIYYIDDKIFPLFNNVCNFIFSSLKQFDIICKENMTEVEILYNLYNNIDKCTNLEKINISLIVKEINANFYLKFIDKILSLKIKECSISISNQFPYNNKNRKELYSYKELKEIFPKKIYEINQYKISKLTNEEI